MILQSLNELYTRLAEDSSYEIAPSGFSPQKVTFRVVLRQDGTVFAVEDARIDGKAITPQVPQPEKRTSGVKAQFLCDKREYVFGIGRDGSKKECFKAFKTKHLASEKEINTPEYGALCRFLEKWNPQDFNELKAPADVFEGFGVFQIQGQKGYLHDLPPVKNWWIKHSNLNEEGELQEQCLITGEIAPIIGIHPDIKGFKSSVALVGIQSNSSYESYGKSKTENCPISKDAAFRYSTALNALLAGPQKKKHRNRLASSTVVHWTESQTDFEDVFGAVFGEDSEKSSSSQDQSRIDQINRLLSAIRSGSKYSDFGDPETPFYMLGLEQPNPGRFSIRFFHRSTIADLLDKLHDHHQCLQTIRQFTEPVGKRLPDSEFPAIWQILRETARVSDEIPPLLGGGLARAIIEGTPYPEGLFSAIIRRIHADRNINYLRAAIIKAALVRNHKQTIPTMLDPAITDPAYRHGRLFAVLEKVQEEGHYSQTQRKLEHTIKDKYFSSACATPAAVFPRLETLSVHHQRHLNPGRRVQFEKLIGDIKWDLSGTKKTHTLVEQGRFILGYYHQRKALFTSNESEQENATESAVA